MNGGAGVRTGLKAALTVVALAVVVPLLVALAPAVGLEPTHWSGTRLADVRLLELGPEGVAAPELANILLSDASGMDETDAGDLAPSYWDADAGQVVLCAVTDRGVSQRRRLGDASATPYRIERRRYSVRALREILDAVPAWTQHGAISSAVDGEGNRVVLTVTRLGHALFSGLATRYGDAVAVIASPFYPPVATAFAAMGGETKPTETVPAATSSWWSRADPVGTWLTLATGFPWYLGAAMALAILAWLLPTVRRRTAIAR